jgi:hypothetical protein
MFGMKQHLMDLYMYQDPRLFNYALRDKIEPALVSVMYVYSKTFKILRKPKVY